MFIHDALARPVSRTVVGALPYHFHPTMKQFPGTEIGRREQIRDSLMEKFKMSSFESGQKQMICVVCASAICRISMSGQGTAAERQMTTREVVAFGIQQRPEKW